MSLIAIAGSFAPRWVDAALPLTPDGSEGRRLAEHELGDPVYQAAQPTVIDRIARAVAQFFERLFDVQLNGGWGSAFAVIASVVVVVVIVVAFIVWGVPRAVRRAPAESASLFGEEEARSAAELRSAAASHALNGEWDAAIVLRFRALARGVFERGVVATPPGATVHAFARSAALVFPSSATELEAAATAFDDVRYLRRPGTAELYWCVADVDDRVTSLRATVPDHAGAPA
ncbi:DUF4129 domain-containing protein [Microbacterium deminutum]|uniref:Protein-glutamine gamma-glutamyltransferase-like C-terminal domain-containing protein n=1 Tax=Microbacterium deminutum TaxID=344164 RepID=A0ABP5BLK8_9MICO